KPKSGDNGQTDTVTNGNKARWRLVKCSDLRLVGRIDFQYRGIFVNHLRFVVAHAVNLVRDLFETRLSHQNTKQFFATDGDSICHSRNDDAISRPPLIGEWIEGNFGWRISDCGLGCG